MTYFDVGLHFVNSILNVVNLVRFCCVFRTLFVCEFNITDKLYFLFYFPYKVRSLWDLKLIQSRRQQKFDWLRYQTPESVSSLFTMNYLNCITFIYSTKFDMIFISYYYNLYNQFLCKPVIRTDSQNKHF